MERFDDSAKGLHKLVFLPRVMFRDWFILGVGILVVLAGVIAFDNNELIDTGDGIVVPVGWMLLGLSIVWSVFHRWYQLKHMLVTFDGKQVVFKYRRSKMLKFSIQDVRVEYNIDDIASYYVLDLGRSFSPPPILTSKEENQLAKAIESAKLKMEVDEFNRIDRE